MNEIVSVTVAHRHGKVETEMDEDATMAMLPQNARLAAREAA